MVNKRLFLCSIVHSSKHILCAIMLQARPTTNQVNSGLSLPAKCGPSNGTLSTCVVVKLQVPYNCKSLDSKGRKKEIMYRWWRWLSRFEWCSQSNKHILQHNSANGQTGGHSNPQHWPEHVATPDRQINRKILSHQGACASTKTQSICSSKSDCSEQNSSRLLNPLRN